MIFKIDTIENMPYLLMTEECTEDYQKDCHIILTNLVTKKYADEILTRVNKALSFWIAPLMQQLELCNYECEGGKLKDLIPYSELKGWYDESV